MDDDALLTKSEAGRLLRRDRKTIATALLDVTPDEAADGGQPARWRRSTVARALAAHERRTAPWRNGRGGNEIEQAADALERAAIRMEGALDRLRREPDLEKRRALYEASQAVIAGLSRLQCSIASMIAHAPVWGRSSSPKAACGAPLGAGLYERPHTGDHRDHVSRA